MSAKPSVQIFGLRKSQATRAAERFFKERSVQIHFVDLEQRPMAPGEIRRFSERFGLLSLVDTASKPYVDGGLQYMRLGEAEWLTRIEQDARLLKLPLVRSGNRLTVGQDDAGWKAMLTP